MGDGAMVDPADQGCTKGAANWKSRPVWQIVPGFRSGCTRYFQIAGDFHLLMGK